MAGIAISYRREDTSGVTGRIFDRLRSHYEGRTSRDVKDKPIVFLDYDSTPAGVDFRNYLKGIFEDCDILLAIIGPNWMGNDGTGKPKIARDDDWVRIEIEIALKKNIPLVPVLIDRTQMPSKETLPEDVRDLYRQAVQVDSQIDFNPHMERLIGQIDRVLGIHTSQAKTRFGFADIQIEPSRLESTKRLAFRIATLAFMALCICAAIAWILFYNQKDVLFRDQKTARPSEPVYTYPSKELGVTIIYPNVFFTLDDTQEKNEQKLVLKTGQRKPFIQILRTALPEHKDVKIGRQKEADELTKMGSAPDYYAPKDEKNWDNWYILSGVADGIEYYFRRWYFDDRVISFEFRYPKKCTPFFDKLIPPMTKIGTGFVPTVVPVLPTDDASQQYAGARAAEGDCFASN